MEAVGVDVFGVAPEMLAQERGQRLREGAAAAGLHLDAERLALVHRHPARLADRLAAPFGGKSLLVEGVPRLVQRAHQAVEEAVLAVARGDAHVVDGAAAEGVQADVEPAARGVEPEARHQVEREPALGLDGEAARERGRDLSLRVERGLDQVGDAGASVPKMSSMRAERMPGS